MEIWSLFDDIMGGASARGSSRFPGPFATQMRLLIADDDDLEGHGAFMDDILRDLAVSRSMELDEKRVEPIDTKAVLSKCRKEVYKPKGSRWGKGKAEAEQAECPVCLEKFVNNDQLLSLPCNHSFHKDCLVPWINSNHGKCPCCRADILGGKKADKPTPSSMNSTSSSRSNNNNISSINANNPIRNTGRPEASNSNRFSNGGRDDIMTILAEMEIAMDSLGFRG